MLPCVLTLLLAAVSISAARCHVYLTGQHNVVPDKPHVSSISHVALAFMRSDVFNLETPAEWPLFTSVEKVRAQFAKGTAVMVAIGGWGDTAGFSTAAATHKSRTLFAQNIAAMIAHTGADGVDVDWEYPGGNGDDYKRVPNSSKAWEIEAYPKLLTAIREAIGPDKLLSAAVPGLRRDMMAFTEATVSLINEKMDFVNIMTYDLMNRRDTVTKHHTGIGLSLDAIDAYLEKGLFPKKVNLGFAFYVKWFKTDPDGGCDKNPVGCKTALLEDPVTGDDLGGTGGFSWHDGIPSTLVESFDKAISNGTYDSGGGGHYYWDPIENLFWTWDTPDAIAKKFPRIVQKKKLGGVFAWGIGEDAEKWAHLAPFTSGVQRHDLPSSGEKSEL